MSSPLVGNWSVGTGEFYSDGDYHGAWDIPCPIGTPVLAVADGRIHSLSRGVPNDGPGDADYPGEPSNWVLLWTRVRGQDYSVYYQHLSPDVDVRTGQQVRMGQRIGESGNSGNTSGPHLHIHVMRGHQTDRYRLYSDRSVAIYPPSRLWQGLEEDDMATPEERRKLINELMTTKIFGDKATKEEQQVTVRDVLRKFWRSK